MDFKQNVNNKAGRRHSSGLSKSLAIFVPNPPLMELAMTMEVSEAIPRVQTQSKLPSYRPVDALLAPVSAALSLDLNLEGEPNADINSSTASSKTSTILPRPQKKHARNQSAASVSPSATRDSKLSPKPLVSPAPPNYTAGPPRPPRHLTFPTSTSTSTSVVNENPPSSQTRSPDVLDLPAPKPIKETTTSTRRVHPAPLVALGRNNKQNNGPPLSMITQGYYEGQALEADSTTNWVAQQSMSLTPESEQPPSSPAQQQSSPSTENSSARPVIKPIRGFKPSSRKSVEMSSRRASRDPDETLRTLEGFEDNDSPRNSDLQHQHRQTEQDEQTASDESDLFLRVAQEEEKTARQSTLSNSNSPSRADSRFSRIGQRASLPPSSATSNPLISRRRGSSQESANGSRPMDEQEGIAQALTYRPTAKDRPTPPEDMNRNRYFTNNSRSNPTTPRTLNGRERSPESTASHGPRKNHPDSSLPPRSSYRQSNLSYTTPRVYNSSPLVSRLTDMHEVPETPRPAEGTESSVSTTAPSTVWDELEDLKSRIHRLELTGKLPATSGAAMSRASHDRPPTATTTVTTISSSPKRGRENSVTQEELAPGDAQHHETHPLLYAALAKSKPILSADIFKALEAATSDALAIASMMGTSGQPGPISSSQSTIGGPATVSDRQVRRKADSMCRSLTELCLALSEAQPESATSVSMPISTPAVAGPPSQDKNELRASIEGPSKTRQLVATDLARVKSTPRALSRLEERRSSLLATSALPSPRYTPSEVGTTPVTGRRTSMFLRTRRAGTEEPEEEDETRFRAPSRATTEIGRLRNSPREYTSQQPLPERQPPIQSSLPVRRHYTSTSLTNTVPPPMPPISSLGGRRYLERSTPERDTSSIASRLAEGREQRKSSISQGFLGRTGSLTRKSRQSTPVDSPSAAQPGHYQ